MEQEILVEDKEFVEKKQKSAIGRTHRVGTITLGTSLVCIGCLFLAHMFLPEISYEFIYKLWPAIFIILGVEILLANYKSRFSEFIYDKTAIFLVAGLIVFSMLMGVIGMVVESERYYYEQQQAKYESNCINVNKI